MELNKKIKKFMSERTDEYLIQLVTVGRYDHVPSDVKFAEEELRARGFDTAALVQAKTGKAVKDEFDKISESPWDFLDSESPNGQMAIIYSGLQEVGMGAPDMGKCSLVRNEQEIPLIWDFGGPAIWNETSDKVAIPMWTEGRKQKIAVVDTANNKFTVYMKEFRVLQFYNFSNNIITGIDSPAHKTTKFQFDILNEDWDRIADLETLGY